MEISEAGRARLKAETGPARSGTVGVRLTMAPREATGRARAVFVKEAGSACC